MQSFGERFCSAHPLHISRHCLLFMKKNDDDDDNDSVLITLASGVACNVSNFISSPSDRKRRNRKKLNNHTIQHNKTKSIDKLSYI